MWYCSPILGSTCKMVYSSSPGKEWLKHKQQQHQHQPMLIFKWMKRESVVIFKYNYMVYLLLCDKIFSPSLTFFWVDNKHLLERTSKTKRFPRSSSYSPSPRLLRVLVLPLLAVQDHRRLWLVLLSALGGRLLRRVLLPALLHARALRHKCKRKVKGHGPNQWCG